MSRVAPGRTVLYRLHDGDVVRILSVRQERAFEGSGVAAGDEVVAVITRVHDADTGLVNLKLLLDGDDTLWVTSRILAPELDTDAPPPRPGALNGTYRFPVAEAVRASS